MRAQDGIVGGAHEPEHLPWGASWTEPGFLRWRRPEASHLRAAPWPSSGAGSSTVSLLIGHSPVQQNPASLPLGFWRLYPKQAPCLCSHLLPPQVPRGTTHISLEAEVTFSSPVLRPRCLLTVAPYAEKRSLGLKHRLIVHEETPITFFQANLC